MNDRQTQSVHALHKEDTTGLRLCVQNVVVIPGAALEKILGAVSYTHLTLPTKRIV